MREWILALLKNKATAQPCRVCLGFFCACIYPVLSEFPDPEQVRSRPGQD